MKYVVKSNSNHDLEELHVYVPGPCDSHIRVHSSVERKIISFDMELLIFFCVSHACVHACRVRLRMSKVCYVPGMRAKVSDAAETP